MQEWNDMLKALMSGILAGLYLIMIAYGIFRLITWLIIRTLS